jgi:hypothetical protein
VECVVLHRLGHLEPGEASVADGRRNAVIKECGLPGVRARGTGIMKGERKPRQGFAAAGQKPPALDTTVDLPSDPEMRAKGFSERLVLIERLN